MLIFPGVLRNYNLTYLNWTWLPSPITSQAIRCFSNTDDCPQELAAVQSAAATWNGSGVAFSFPQIQEGPPPPHGGFSGIIRDIKNQIGWLSQWPREYPHKWAAATMAWINVNADPSRILEVDTAFNDEWKTWSTESTPPYGAFNVQSVMLHEFGHWLQLWHSAAITQGQTPIVMQPTILPAGVGESGLRRNLSPDDIDVPKLSTTS